MTDDESIAREITLATIWARKSVPLPFDVDINVRSSDMILPLVAPLLPYMNRWRNFSLSGKSEETTTILSSDEPVEQCSDLILNFAEYESEDEENDTRSIFTRRHPDSQRCIMTLWVHELPSSELLLPLDFTNLTILECIPAHHTNPLAVIDFLSACPQLESFYLWGWVHEDAALTGPPPIVHLPKLVTMTLKSTSMTRALLTAIDAPNLERLYLTSLNVDFQLPPYYAEEGDSDDEANDPSQSPSSDHATGMGLRSIISRCHPPLKVLEMDFSDMRTKDFHFAFSHLNVLEEFLIIASDMSDKVIKLLQPYPSKADDMSVRLPKLKKLALHNCQRLEGAAIVDALSMRTEFTDANATSALNAFTRVEVLECEGFAPRHSHLLAKSLGNRLRFD